MRFELVHNLKIPKIGFGTWTIGGRSSVDRAQDSHSLQTLRSALDLGYTHFDTAEMYGHGHAEELLGHAIRESGVPLKDLFITSKVAPEHLGYAEVLVSCENSLRRLGIETLDLYLIHWPGIGMRLEETFRALNKLVADGKVRHLGVSNFDLKLLKQAQSFSATPLLTNQVPYSLADRTYMLNGVIEYCQANDILITAYSPVKQSKSIFSPHLLSIAQAHQVTPYQVTLAWLVQQPRVITIPMSNNPRHQAENLASGGISLSIFEMEQLGG